MCAGHVRRQRTLVDQPNDVGPRQPEQIGRLQQGRISTYLLYSFVTLAALLLIVL